MSRFSLSMNRHFVRNDSRLMRNSAQVTSHLSSCPLSITSMSCHQPNMQARSASVNSLTQSHQVAIPNGLNSNNMQDSLNESEVDSEKNKSYNGIYIFLFFGCSLTLLSIWAIQLSLVISTDAVLVITLVSVFLLMFLFACWIAEFSNTPNHQQHQGFVVDSSPSQEGIWSLLTGMIRNQPPQNQYPNQQQQSQEVVRQVSHAASNYSQQSTGFKDEKWPNGNGPPDYHYAITHSMPVVVTQSSCCKKFSSAACKRSEFAAASSRNLDKKRDDNTAELSSFQSSYGSNTLPPSYANTKIVIRNSHLQNNRLQSFVSEKEQSNQAKSGE